MMFSILTYFLIYLVCKRSSIFEKSDKKVGELKNRNIDYINVGQEILSSFGIGRPLEPGETYVDKLKAYNEDLFNQLWEVLSYYKLFGKEEKKQAELVCRIEMYKLEHKEFVKFTHTGKSDHYTIKSTLKGNAHLQFLYDLKTNLFHIGYDSTFIETRLFYLNEESIIEINLGTEKGRINNSFQKEKVFELMHKSQQKVIKKYEQ